MCCASRKQKNFSPVFVVVPVYCFLALDKMHFYHWFTPVIAVFGLFILILAFYFIFRSRRSSSSSYYTGYGWYRSRPCVGPNVVVVDQAPVVAVVSSSPPTPVIVANKETAQAANEMARDEASRNPNAPPPQVVVMNN